MPPKPHPLAEWIFYRAVAGARGAFTDHGHRRAIGSILRRQGATAEQRNPERLESSPPIRIVPADHRRVALIVRAACR